MYLKRLEMSGFKSFANKVALDFLPECSIAEGGSCGITAIVGPNGSGKSNVADAIRWAIGEQSVKNLRGKKSEDVIFAGTDKKARLGTASVSLVFDNSDKRIPIEFSEVTITRKIYRSGESEYLINGNRVRLLDIVDLLAKSGIGRDSYCVITQGMSDAVLNASPIERRSIFEDAAGVKQYQIEKERALRKLESTKENLARVDALTIEIEPHLKNLKRQAEKASQGKDIAERLRMKQELLYGFLWHQFQTERGTLLAERNQLENVVREGEEAVKELQQTVEEASKNMQSEEAEETLGKEISRLRERVNRLLREKSVEEGKKEIEQEKRKEREVISTIPVDLPYVKESLEKIRRDQDRLIERLRSVEKLEDLQDILEFATVIKQKLFDLGETAKAGSVTEKRIIGLNPEEKAESDARLRVIEETMQKITSELTQYEGLLKESETKLAEIRSASRASREMFFAKEREWRERERSLQQLKDNFNELKVRLARIEVREEDLTALVKEELNRTPDTLSYDGTLVERERLEREIARLKVEVEHIGTIDPLVVEEYEETSKRYEFLAHESEDLKKAIESLRTVIREMDTKIDAAFESTFKEIKKKFSEYFQTIFGGGKADIEQVRIPVRRRTGDEAVLEGEVETKEEEKDGIGIEIFACPPGKRITNLSMLSGGERSLTSLALLFAIISHNPPPFAVLDEVEAALDEANSRRFSRMLEELSARTQFVAITHNRETMRQASLLYGVTMGTDGVSQLLSVRLDQVGEKGEIVQE